MELFIPSEQIQHGIVFRNPSPGMSVLFNYALFLQKNPCMKRILAPVFLLLLSFSAFSQYKISGHVNYAGTNPVSLDSATVTLSQAGITLAQTNVNMYGYFQFLNLAPGNYTLNATTTKKWGGVNSTDAYKVMLHFVNISPLTGLAQTAANVDASPMLNSLDAYLISKRFVNAISAFPGGDWFIETKSVTIGNQNVTVEMSALCRGDADGSYNPPASFTCGGALVDNRDGQSYTTGLFGTQCWMTKNLNIGTFVYGVGNQENNQVIEKYCYSNITGHCTTFGGLYQWREMMQYDTVEGGQGICPTGWHVPTDAEWGVLINQYGGAGAAGVVLQSGGTSGFNALLGGWVYNCSKFRQMYYQGYYWSSTQYWGLYGMARMFTLQLGGISNPYKSKDDGMYVRCLKD